MRLLYLEYHNTKNRGLADLCCCGAFLHSQFISVLFAVHRLYSGFLFRGNVVASLNLAIASGGLNIFTVGDPLSMASSRFFITRSDLIIKVLQSDSSAMSAPLSNRFSNIFLHCCHKLFFMSLNGLMPCHLE